MNRNRGKEHPLWTGPEGHEDARTESLLRALANAEPGPGLERRILQRIAKPQSRSRVTLPALRGLAHRSFAGVGAGPALAMALTTCVLLLATWLGPGRQMRNHRSPARPQTTTASSYRTADLHSSAAVHGGGAGPGTEPRTTTARPLTLPGSRRVRASERGTPASSWKSQERGPGPSTEPMPLTEQERLLIAIAQSHDPVPIAMLDPVERHLQIERERVATARFFAPAPLPPDLQGQINAALRSQYVNTPPPAELLAQIDRSTR